MGSRLSLQTLLETILGSKNVYYQAPPTNEMHYDCIVYKRNYIKTKFAGNKPYAKNNRYTIMVITKSPDSEIPDKVAALPMCSFDRAYTASNLNHTVFNLYY